MKRAWMGALALGAGMVLVSVATGQPPDERGPGRGRHDGPPFGRAGDMPPPPPGRYEPGKLMPPHIREALNLSDEQQEQLNQLEKDCKHRLMKMLTKDQQAKLRALAQRGRGGPGGPPGSPGLQERRLRRVPPGGQPPQGGPGDGPPPGNPPPEPPPGQNEPPR